MTQSDDALFAAASQGAVPVKAKGRQIRGRPEKSRPRQANQSTAKALADLLASKLEFALAHTGEHMEGYVQGLDPAVLQKLRAGTYSPENHLDLHGQNARQAFDTLLWFIQNAYQRNLRCVLVVTGRGKNSPDGMGVLRLQLQLWLTKDPFKRVVLAFCSAKPSDGGTGAAYILLRKCNKSRGKIVWQRT